MKMIRMVAIAEHQYAGHRLHADDEYDCEEIHVAVMQRLGWARPKATDAEAKEVDPQPERGRYRRRDMRAQ